jgi:hypothetical protein
MGIGKTVAGDPGSRGAGDISYIVKYVDCIDGLGSSGKGAHAAGETINLKISVFNSTSCDFNLQINAKLKDIYSFSRVVLQLYGIAI